ncbi:MAG: VanW family protein [Oscillospiraceae bacterium]|nr:VanW family protein [Oscillospiraceae bacterium]
MELVGRSRKSKKRKIIIISLIIFISLIVAGAIASFIALGYYVDSLDTVFPNVWAEGVDLSGLTLAEATRALQDSGYERNAEQIAVTIIFPDDNSFTVTGNEAGLALDASEPALGAYVFGRGGTFFQNTIAYINSLFNTTVLESVSIPNSANPNRDDSVLRELADEYAQEFNKTLYDNSLDITDTQITIIKGTGLYPADADEVYSHAVSTLTRAISQNTHIEARYMVETNADDTIDLQALYEYIHIDPISSVYDPDTTSGTASAEGRTFDLQAAQRSLANAAVGVNVIIPIITIKPEISKEEIDDMLFRDLLGERQAYQNSNFNRTTNIVLAGSHINGTVLQPGETFSYNAVVGFRGEEEGFLEASGYLHGRIEPSIGGGVCQVSSAIYSAVLQTDLEIVSRRNHGLTVSYQSQIVTDATVQNDVLGQIDFRFKNTSQYPIRIDVTTSGTVTVNVKIYGTRIPGTATGDSYKLIRDLIERKPVEIVERESEDVPPGERILDMSGMEGFTYDIYRIRLDEDKNLIDKNGDILLLVNSRGNQVYTRDGNEIWYKDEHTQRWIDNQLRITDQEGNVLAKWNEEGELVDRRDDKLSRSRIEDIFGTRRISRDVYRMQQRVTLIGPALPTPPPEPPTPEVNDPPQDTPPGD